MAIPVTRKTLRFLGIAALALAAAATWTARAEAPEFSGARAAVHGLVLPSSPQVGEDGSIVLTAEVPVAPGASRRVLLKFDPIWNVLERADGPALVVDAGERGTARLPSGDALLADRESGEILRIRPDGRSEKVAGGFERPEFLAYDASDGFLYVLDVPTPGVPPSAGGRNALKRVNLEGGAVETLAGASSLPLGLALAGEKAFWVDGDSGVLFSADLGERKKKDNKEKFDALLSGADEVPPVNTTTTGTVRFKLKLEEEDDVVPAGPESSRLEDKENRLEFHLKVRRIVGATAGHIHLGAPGVNGPVVAELFSSSRPSPRPRELEREGKIYEEDLVGPLAGDWDGFVSALRAGQLYVNVHTQLFPSGEIRGQIIPQGGVSNRPPNGTILAPAGDVTISEGESVSFAGAVSDPDGDTVSVLWDFGDGSSSTDLNPGDHLYASAGTYTVTFTATDAGGLSDPTPDSRIITVEGSQNAPPEGVIVEPPGDVSILAGESVTFSGSATDPDGDTVTVLWNFGDGSTSTLLNPGAHVYASAGTYSVTFTATDEHGLADPTPDTRTITVNAPANNPPNGTITAPAGNVTITAGQSVTFSGSATDPDGDTVTVLWNFGDGSTSTMLNPGAHVYASAGTYSVTFTATDEHGLADPTPDTRTITVNAAAPTFTFIQTSIFTPKCINCHAGSSPEAGLDLSAGQAYGELINVPAESRSGIRVIPGDPNNSVLYTFLAAGHRSSQVTAADRQAIFDWIASGAPNN